MKAYRSLHLRVRSMGVSWLAKGDYQAGCGMVLKKGNQEKQTHLPNMALFYTHSPTNKSESKILTTLHFPHKLKYRGWHPPLT